jgi:hypothetical protein
MSVATRIAIQKVFGDDALALSLRGLSYPCPESPVPGIATFVTGLPLYTGCLIPFPLTTLVSEVAMSERVLLRLTEFIYQALALQRRSSFPGVFPEPALGLPFNVDI